MTSSSLDDTIQQQLSELDETREAEHTNAVYIPLRLFLSIVQSEESMVSRKEKTTSKKE